MKLFSSILFLFLVGFSKAQTDSTTLNYNQAFEQIKTLLEREDSLSFKEAVFITENAYFNNELNHQKFNQAIQEKIDIAKLWLNNNHLMDYSFKDSTEFAKNGAIFKLMTDTIFLFKGTPISFPYQYDFDDFFGEQDWTKMFVSKLLATGKGNCHSMPMLYKVLADEIGTNAYFSFAPNHLYIKQKSLKHGWYNTELTSSAFPIDAWIMASGYISRETIISGIYMDKLTEKQSISLCLIDLAHGYQRKSQTNSLDFVLKCCDLALKYYPNYINALLLKSETLKTKFDQERNPQIKQELFTQMENTYSTIVDLGYREIPKTVYFEWLSELANNKEKYQNKKLIGTFNNENSVK